jgi:hypothetical protein
MGMDSGKFTAKKKKTANAREGTLKKRTRTALELADLGELSVPWRLPLNRNERE